LVKSPVLRDAEGAAAETVNGGSDDA